jgi:hypothetical protein
MILPIHATSHRSALPFPRTHPFVLFGFFDLRMP